MRGIACFVIRDVMKFTFYNVQTLNIFCPFDIRWMF